MGDQGRSRLTWLVGNDSQQGWAIRCRADDRHLDRIRTLLDPIAGSHRSAQRTEALGVKPDRIYLEHGLTGTNRQRPGLDQALAAVRTCDTLVVPKPDRPARSVPDALAIGDELARQGVALSLGGQVQDPTDPIGKMFFDILRRV